MHHSSTDIVRSKRYDSTARLFNPSLTFGEYHNGAMVYRNIDINSYFSPFDRIARLYTINASGLTMKEAIKIAKLGGFIA
jgi:hypothetical protein